MVSWGFIVVGLIIGLILGFVAGTLCIVVVLVKAGHEVPLVKLGILKPR